MEGAPVRTLELEVEIAGEAMDSDEVDRRVAQDGVSDRDIASSGVTDLRGLHRHSLARPFACGARWRIPPGTRPDHHDHREGWVPSGRSNPSRVGVSVRWSPTRARISIGADEPRRWAGCSCEEDRFPVLRPLVAVTVVAGAFRVRRADAVARAGSCRRGSRRRWCVLPRPPLRPPARLAVPAACRGRRPDVEDRDRHRGHRHALREPVLHGGGRRGGRPPGRWPAAARHQSWVARAGHRRLALLRLPAGGGRDRRRDGTAPRRGVPRAPQGRGVRRSRIRGRCSRTRRACCPSSPVRRDCESGSGGARRHRRPRRGRPPWA